MNPTEKRRLERLLATILDWSDDHSEFDPGFVVLMQEKLEKSGWLSQGQVQALENICKQWRILDGDDEEVLSDEENKREWLRINWDDE